MRNLSKRDYSILIASTIDHFDTALYGFLAPIFAKLYFPTSDPIISLILAYSVLATTIITRPLGSYIFGILALTHGPAMSLSYSLIGVAITTFALGFLPTYYNIGYYAPLLLVVLRSLGGIFSAGEITIARLYILSEDVNSTSIKNSYLYQTSTMLGIILASFASTIILNNFETQYWRICFIMGGIAALFGYILRIYKTEKLSLNNKQLLSFYSMNGIYIMWKNRILLYKVALLAGFSYMTYSIPFIIMNNLVPEFTKITLAEMMLYNTPLLIIDMILLLIFGYWIVRFQPKKILLLCAIILSISILPLWYFIENASLLYVMSIKLWIIIIGITFSCSINLWYHFLIPQTEKYLIIGMGSALGSAIIGKMAPVICLSLYYYTESPMTTGIFITLISLGAIWAILAPFPVKSNN